MGMVTGVVGACGKNRYGWYLKLEGHDEWFNSKYEIKASKGDSVEFDNGGKNYVNKLKIVGSGSSSGTSKASSAGNTGERDRSIIRQNALRHAAVIIAATMDSTISPSEDDATIDRVLHMAKRFEEYSSGELAAKAKPAQSTESDKDFLDDE